MPQTKIIDLSKIGKGLSGITPAYGASLAEAGAVCLAYHNHKNGVALDVKGTFSAEYNLYWNNVSGQMRRTYNDMEDATEHGAYCIAILLIMDLTGHTVLEKSRKGTGFDFWLGFSNGDLPFQNQSRLEVSGILEGNLSQVNSRIRQKLNQVSVSDKTQLPAYVVVVEFSSPLSRVEKK